MNQREDACETQSPHDYVVHDLVPDTKFPNSNPRVLEVRTRIVSGSETKMHTQEFADYPGIEAGVYPDRALSQEAASLFFCPVCPAIQSMAAGIRSGESLDCWLRTACPRSITPGIWASLLPGLLQNRTHKIHAGSRTLVGESQVLRYIFAAAPG